MTAVDDCSVIKVCNYIGDIIPSDINTLYPTPINSLPHKVPFYSIRANILVISEYGLSTCQIVFKTGLEKSTMAKAIKEIVTILTLSCHMLSFLIFSYGLIPSFSYEYPYWACEGD